MRVTITQYSFCQSVIILLHIPLHMSPHFRAMSVIKRLSSFLTSSSRQDRAPLCPPTHTSPMGYLYSVLFYAALLPIFALTDGWLTREWTRSCVWRPCPASTSCVPTAQPWRSSQKVWQPHFACLFVLPMISLTWLVSWCLKGKTDTSFLLPSTRKNQAWRRLPAS